MSNNRQQQVDSFLKGVTQQELESYINENKLNLAYIKNLNRIKQVAPKTHFGGITDVVLRNFNKECRTVIDSVNKLGQAQIIAVLLNQFYDEDYKVSDVKSFFKALMDEDKELKEYVYEIMKDY